MPPERPAIPGWAHYERKADLEWIGVNLDLFWTTATGAYADTGRGVIVVDATVQRVPDTITQGIGCRTVFIACGANSVNLPPSG